MNHGTEYRIHEDSLEELAHALNSMAIVYWCHQDCGEEFPNFAIQLMKMFMVAVPKDEEYMASDEVEHA
jgi:hypothetical protein